MSELNGDSQLPARIEGGSALAPDSGRRALATFAQLEPSTPPLSGYLSLLLRRKRAILLSLALVLALTVIVTALTPRTYEATATLLISEISNSRSQSSADDTVPPTIAAMGSPNLDTHVQLLQGEATAAETARYLRENGGPLLTTQAVRSSVKAKAVRDTQLVRVSAASSTPADAQSVADAAAKSYVRLNRQRARGSSESTGRYLAEQLAIAKQKLTKAEDALRRYQESTGTVAADAAASDLLARAAALRSDGDRTGADLAQARQRETKVRSQLAQQNRNIGSGQVRDNTVIQLLRTKLADLEGQRLAAKAKYTDAYPGPLTQIEEQIRLTRDQLDEEIRHVVRGGGGDLQLQQTLTSDLIQAEATVAALQARHRQLQADLQQANRELGRLPSRQINLAGLQRQVDVAQNVYSDLLRRSQEVEVGRVMALGNADIVESAPRPRLPVRPNVPLNLVLGLLLGLGVGVGVALLQEQLDTTVRDQVEAARLADAPVLGTIPMFHHAKNPGMLPGDFARDTAVEAYRGLRYCLDFAAPGGRGRVVLITSSGPLEGKTTTVINLASAVARTGKRVILADTDLRRSGLRRALRFGELPGMTDVLTGEAKLDDVIQKLQEPGMYFLSSGKQVPNPMELLDSQALRGLVEELRGRADLVILDSPPLLAVADGLVLAGVSDAVLMVCVPGKSGRRDLQLARELLSHVGESISGVVLNKIGPGAGYSYHSRYYY